MLSEQKKNTKGRWLSVALPVISFLGALSYVLGCCSRIGDGYWFFAASLLLEWSAFVVAIGLITAAWISTDERVSVHAWNPGAPIAMGSTVLAVVCVLFVMSRPETEGARIVWTAAMHISALIGAVVLAHFALSGKRWKGLKMAAGSALVSCGLASMLSFIFWFMAGAAQN